MCIDRIGGFLLAQGYLRDEGRFTFAVEADYGGKRIRQAPGDFLENLHRDGVGYALYVMGYPAILPSAVYLFQMYGEAQHHSSRIFEELFASVGVAAREVDDFDPTGYPPDRVVELWTVQPV